MKDILMKAKENKILSGTVIVTIGSLLNSFFSYLLQLFLGRNLTLAEFGTYNALLSLFSILGVVSIVLSISLVKLVSDLMAKDKFDILTSLYKKISLFFTALGVFIIFIIYLLRHGLSNYFNIEEPYLFVALGLYFATNLLFIIPSSYLKGFLRFKALAFLSALSGVFRLVLAVLAVYVGYKVGGVYLSLSVSLILVYLSGFLIIKKNFRQPNQESNRKYYKEMLKFSIPTTVMYFGMFSLNNIDLVLVKKFFDPVLVGYYAGVVILGKVILFGVNPITVVMFPQISSLKSAGENYLEKFKVFLLLMIAALVSAIAIYNTVPEFIAKLLFGERFIASAAYLPSFSIFVSLYVLLNFIIMFFMAIDKTKIALLSLPAAILQFVLISFWHSSLNTVIRINILVTGVVLAILSFYLYKLARESAR